MCHILNDFQASALTDSQGNNIQNKGRVGKLGTTHHSESTYIEGE